jgi:hypothetical protein
MLLLLSSMDGRWQKLMKTSRMKRSGKMSERR